MSRAFDMRGWPLRVAGLPAWLRHYRRDQALRDGVAGLVVSVHAAVQSLAA